jgi:hypothetical protein
MMTDLDNPDVMIHLSGSEAAEAGRRLQAQLSGADWEDKVGRLRGAMRARSIALESQLKRVVEESVSGARSGLAVLGALANTSQQLRSSLLEFHSLGSQASERLGPYELMKRAALLRRRLAETRRELERLVAIPARAARLEEALEEGRLLEVWEELQDLARVRVGLASSSARLEREWEAVDRCTERLEQEMWQTLRDCLRVVEEAPQRLLEVVRIVEREDHSPYSARGYLGTAFEVLSEAIEARFAPLHPRTEKGEGAGSTRRLQLEPLLEGLEARLAELRRGERLLAPVFPPRWDIVGLLVRRHHQQTHALFRALSAPDVDMSTADLLALVRWVQERYEPEMQTYRLAGLEPPLLAALGELTAAYKEHLARQMRAWIARLLRQDLEGALELQAGPDGLLFTEAPHTLFALLHQQLEVTASANQPLLLQDVRRECVRVLLEYQRAFLERMQRPAPTPEQPDPSLRSPLLPFEYLLAQVNNASRGEAYLDELEPQLRAGGGGAGEEFERNLEAAREGFARLRRTALRRLADYMQHDLRSALDRLFSHEWYEASPGLVESVVVTIKDYLVNDVEGRVPAAAVRELEEECLERVVRAYAAALLAPATSRRRLLPEALPRLELDIDLLHSFFQERLVRQALLDQQMDLLRVLHRLLQADPVLVPAHFETLVALVPDASVNVLETLLERRPNEIEKPQLREILDRCRKIWNHAQEVGRVQATGPSLSNLPSSAPRKHEFLPTKRTRAFFTKVTKVLDKLDKLDKIDKLT